ncbi:MAG TPA: hypothetical protein VMV57_00655 [Terracidiphilus sp.]|nr:hypothetical protein [Terracidiphilus sp.]
MSSLSAIPNSFYLHGERGRQFCTADACFHIEFLAGAIDTRASESFGSYSLWTARMLAARGIALHGHEESLALLEEHPFKFFSQMNLKQLRFF